jgi:DNA-binding MarR family transcriptional regulator
VETTLTRNESAQALARQIEIKLQSIRQIMRKPLEAQYARGHLTGPQMLIMEVVCKHEGISLKDLSKSVSLAHSTVSDIVDRLEKRGFVARKSLETDKRVTQIYPSPSVREFLQKRAPALTLHPLARALKKALPAEQRAILNGVTLLEKLLTKE